ncbi:MAG: ketosteroid isomerase-like protein [Acidobacteria bacterium]|nr:ketosteroid isomerase-like protein [Acidobacteriota bacterium]
MSAEQIALATRYSAAWGAHDPDAIVALHTEDTVFHMHGMAEPVIGAAATRRAIAALFVQWPDIQFQRKTAYFGDGHIVTEYVVSGTVDGAPFACDGVDVFQLRDGRLARKDTYLDTITYQRQLGLDPAATNAT